MAANHNTALITLGEADEKLEGEPKSPPPLPWKIGLKLA